MTFHIRDGETIEEVADRVLAYYDSVVFPDAERKLITDLLTDVVRNGLDDVEAIEGSREWNREHLPVWREELGQKVVQELTHWFNEIEREKQQ